MAFTGSFTIAQNADVQSFILTDTSSYGSEGTGTFASRHIFVIKYDGTYAVPEGTTTDYIDFPFGEGSIKTLNLLQEDESYLIRVVWDSLAPQPGSTYTAEDDYTFTANLNLFSYGLTRMQVSNNLLINDNNFFYNKLKLRELIESAIDAGDHGDQYEAQICLNMATNLKNNETSFF